MRDRISPERQTLYYVGMGISFLGVLLFLSNFFISFSGHTGGFPSNGFPGGALPDFPSREGFRRHEDFGRGMMVRGIGGMVLIGLGQFIAKIGSHGLAGSGVVLDPKRARKDLEPYSRMKGGMFGDAVDESGILDELKGGNPPAVMIRCRDCKQLNEEDSKFCLECGKRI